MTHSDTRKLDGGTFTVNHSGRRVKNSRPSGIGASPKLTEASPAATLSTGSTHLFKKPFPIPKLNEMKGGGDKDER